MNKAAIVTIVSDNYGNRFQNYALQETINELGFSAITFKREYFHTKDKRIKSIIGRIFLYCYNNIPVIRKYVSKNKNLAALLKRGRFSKFNSENINFSKKTSDINDENYLSNIDKLICGSDQVWNPLMSFNSNLDFLEMVNIDKKIAFSPSFGINEIPSDKKNNIRNLLLDFRYLSAREYQGVKIIKELTGKKAELILDPTLLISKNKWKSISKPVPWVSGKPFMLTYVLGDLSKKPTQNQEEKLHNIATYYEFENIRIFDERYNESYSIGPSEFLFLLDKCNLVCTDSYHATIFSILFNKPVVIFKREIENLDMNSRFETLFRKFNIEDRKIENIDDISNILDIDYSEINKVIDNEKKHSYQYLKNALETK